jgi:hypothetical protein
MLLSYFLGYDLISCQSTIEGHIGVERCFWEGLVGEMEKVERA